MFAEEAKLDVAEVDPEGRNLVKKWKTIISLQRKLEQKEEEIKTMQ